MVTSHGMAQTIRVFFAMSTDYTIVVAKVIVLARPRWRWYLVDDDMVECVDDITDIERF